MIPEFHQVGRLGTFGGGCGGCLLGGFSEEIGDGFGVGVGVRRGFR